jgi:ATP-dependent helicase HrpA
LRRWCRQNFLAFLRVREWQDLHEQLTGIVAGQELPRNDRPAASSALHQAILTGFLGGIGVLDENRTYIGARDARFVIAPGTPLAKRPPRWIVAASLVETQRLYARTVAQVQPSWIESAGAHLVRRTYGDAHWVPERGMVMARETVSLYGRVLSSGRQVNFATIDPALARRMFVEEALLRGRSPLDCAFLARNAQARLDVEALEARLRRRDLLAADDVLVDFYLERIPADVASTRAFERWWRDEARRHPHRLDVPPDVLLAVPAPECAPSEYPDHLNVDGNELPLRYVFDPTSPDDGVTLSVPLTLLGALSARRCEWLVPGFLTAKIVALLRGLPKDVRRELVPIPAAAARLRGRLGAFGEGSLFERLAALVTEAAGIRVDRALLGGIALPPWLQMNFSVLDPAGRELRRGRDLDTLRRDLRSRAAASGSRVAHGHPWEREGVRTWDFAELPEQVQLQSSGVSLRMVPGLEDCGTAVRLRLFATAEAAHAASPAGVVRLAALAMPQQTELISRHWAGDREFALLVAAAGFDRALFREIADRAVAEAMGIGERGLPRTASEFAARVDAARARVAERGDAIGRIVKAVLVAFKDARAALGELGELGAPAFSSGRTAIARQLETLLAPGWVRQTPAQVFHQLPKYVRAAAHRAERLRNDVERDRKLDAQLVPFETALQALVARADPTAPAPERERLRWMIEEFRLSLFAQELRTLGPVSAKRLEEQLRRARAEAG